LRLERHAVEEALARMPELRFVGMEHFGSRADDARTGSMALLAQCHLYVGVLGARYGSGITEAEYDEAVSRGIPCLVYLKREDDSAAASDDGAQKLQAFRQKLKRSLICEEFSTPAELGMLVATGVHVWLSEQRIPTPQADAVGGVSAREPPSDADGERLDALATRVRRTWIDGVLLQSLSDLLPLPASKSSDPVDHPWQGVLMRAGEKEVRIDGGSSLGALFEDVNQSLLLLGEPGSGKTTCLLILARELLERRATDPRAPVPIVFNLSLWRPAAGAFMKWLAEELQLRYGIPKAIGQRWLSERRLLPLLDGLDEVATGHRAACVQAVNDWLVQGDVPGVVVCCRTNDYLGLPRLKLLGALQIQPLDRQQIDAYLAAAGPALSSLRDTLGRDAVLSEMAQSPLLLTLMRATARGAPSIALPAGGDSGRGRLFDAFIDLMFARRGGAHPPFGRAPMLGWLCWLAQRLQYASVTMLTLGEMQPWLLPTNAQRLLYVLVSRFLISLVIAAAFSHLGFAEEAAWICGISAGVSATAIDTILIAGRGGPLNRAIVRSILFTAVAILLAGVLLFLFVLLTGEKNLGPWGQVVLALATILAPFWLILALQPALAPAGTDITVPAYRRWKSRSAVRGAIVGWGLAYIATGSGCLAMLLGSSGPVTRNELIEVALFGLYYSAAGLIGGLVFGGWQPALDTGYNRRLGAVWRGLFVALLTGTALAAGVYATLWLVDKATLAGWIPSLVDDLGRLPRGGVAVMIGTLTTLWFGGAAAIKHATLRAVLVASGLLPARMTSFLEHATSLALMRRVGDAYFFMHRSLLDHLATRAEPVPAH